MKPPDQAKKEKDRSPGDGVLHRRALLFVVLLGTVSLFADVTYEGARSITGPFLALLGASGAAVGLVAGAGELTGYGLRLCSGYLADRTRWYWGMTLLGYTVNLLAVPAMALAGNWEVAAFLMVVERMGKGLRNPPRDVMLSQATSRLGRGWGFGLHEAMDQIGAVAGPLLAAGVLAQSSDFRAAFAILGLAAGLALVTLVAARITFPRPEELEPRQTAAAGEGLGRVFWVYTAAAGLIAAGYADFPLIAFRLQKEGLAEPAWIPLLYALAMGVDAVAALVFGRLFDRYGLPVLAFGALAAAAFAPLVFLGGFRSAALGMVCWGIGMGAQESVLRAAVAEMVPARRRGTAYGYFNALYGLCWFLGSAAMGFLLDVSTAALVAFSVTVQLAAFPLLLLARRARPSGR